MFNKDFLWGSASAAYQIEGAAFTDGKGLSIWDEYSKVPGNTFKDTTGEVAIDFYHKYKEDILLMKEMGLKSYRFSISWPRIMPDGYGEVNQKGIKFYHNVIDLLIENNIEPIITIYHWDLPNQLQEEYGGFENRKIINHFVEYCRVLFNEYGSKVKYWVTLNEQNIFTMMGYIFKLHPPKINDLQRFINANHNANVANACAIKLFREIVKEGKIGASFAYSPTYAASENPVDIIAMENAQELKDYMWMDVYVFGRYPKIALKLFEKLGVCVNFEEGDKELLQEATPDFMGLNYYQSNTVSKANVNILQSSKNSVESDIDNPFNEIFNIIDNKYLDKTKWNWIIDPIGLEVALRRIYSRYNIPILITENGLGAFDCLEDGKVHDQYRIDYLKNHVDAIENAIDLGVEVIGYCTWSFQDLFSWLNGYQKRYGFVYIDRNEEDEKELKRYKKDSFYWYQTVIETNGKVR